MRDRIKGVLGVLTMALTGAVAVVETPMPAHAAAAGDGDVVVKLIADPDCSLGAIAARFPIEAVSTVLSTRRIHLVRWKDPLKWTIRNGDELARKLGADECVGYAERNREVQLTDERYHAWPTGLSVPSNEQEWRQQSSTRKLRLADARTLSTGAGVRVAVLDTGTDPSHPALDGRVTPGWDYIDDDRDPFDEVGGPASGHGTFVAGVVHLVAPAARVISMRVLDAQGNGDGYVIAEAIYDAVQMGAKVVNLSLGTAEKLESKVLTDMIRWARSKGTLTTAAAGNDGLETRHWPAAQPEVISVAALNEANTKVAWYSTSGAWVDVAALGTKLISLVPHNGYEAWSGTSMATPVVSAQLALILATDPRLGPARVEEHIRRTCWAVADGKLRYGAIDIPASIRRALR